MDKKIDIKPGYKKTKFGLIPLEWDISTIGKNTLKVGSGSTPRGGEKVYTNSGIIFIRSQNVNYNRLLLEDVRFIPDSIHKSMRGTVVKPNDVLLNITGASIGRSCVVPKSFTEGNVNQHVCIIRPKKELSSYFFQSFLSSFYGQKTIFQTQVGGNREGINHSDIRKIKFPLPPLTEQTRIAQILSTWDKAILTLEQLIEKKQKLKKGLMQVLLTGKVRFEEFVKEEGFKETKLGELPKDWDVAHLSEITKILLSNVDKKSSNEEIPVLLCNYMDVYSNEYITKEIKYMQATAKVREIKKFTLQKEDVIITKDSETQDDIAIPAVVTEHLDGVLCGYHLAVLRPNKKKMYGFFLSKALQENNTHHHFIRLANGITRFGLTSSSIEKALVPLPSLDEQRKIAEVLIDSTKEIIRLKKELEIIREQKRGMMQKLLTGEVRVNIDDVI